MSRPDRSLRGIATTAAFRMSGDDESEPISRWDEEDDPDAEDDWDEDDWDDEDERDAEDEDDLF